MSDSSIYKYFRPMTVISSIIGQFSAERIWVDSSHQLHYKRFTLSVLMFIVGRVAYVTLIVVHLSYHPIYIICRALFNFVYFTFCGTMFLVRSKAIIKAFKIIDILKDNLIKLPPALKPELTNPTTFSIVTTSLLFAFGGIGGILQFYFIHSSWLKYPVLIVFFSSAYLMFTRTFLLSSLLYSCSLVITDTVQAWRLYRRRFCRPFDNLKGFCRLVLTQTRCTGYVNKILSSQILVILLYFIFVTVMRVFSTYHTVYQSQLVSLYMFITITTCVSLLGVSAVLPRIRMNEMNHQVFAMAVRDMPKKDAYKVRLLLEQTHDSQVEPTAAGFWHVRPDIILFFLSLQIEFFLLLEYYKSQVRELSGLSASSVVTTSDNFTMTSNNTTVISSYSALYTP